MTHKKIPHWDKNSAYAFYQESLAELIYVYGVISKRNSPLSNVHVTCINIIDNKNTMLQFINLKSQRFTASWGRIKYVCIKKGLLTVFASVDPI